MEFREPARDARWELVERIASSPQFDKAPRVRDFFLHVCCEALGGRPENLTEQHIGVAVFGRKEGYNPADDSLVRVQARQVRLRLQEYFRAEGREEALVIDIPKGGYTPVFRDRNSAPETAPPARSHADAADEGLLAHLRRALREHTVAVAVPAVLAAACIALTVQNWNLRQRVEAVRVQFVPSPAPWLLTAAFDKATPVTVVLPDAAYGTFQGLSGHLLTLEHYLDPGYPASVQGLLPGDARWVRTIGARPLTSYSEALIAQQMGQMAAARGWRFSIRHSRDLKMRDLARGNFILVGSSMSNPWVSLYEKDLAFQSRWDVPGDVLGFRDTAAHEKAEPFYASGGRNGEPGVAYAVVALIDKSDAGSGGSRALILEGTNMEATEAAWNFVSAGVAQPALPAGVSMPSIKPGARCQVEFLLETKAMAGSPGAFTVRKLYSR